MNNYQSQQFWNSINSIIGFTTSIVVMGFMVGMVRPMGKFFEPLHKPEKHLARPVVKEVTVPGGSYWRCSTCGKELSPGTKVFKVGKEVYCSIPCIKLPEHHSNPVEIYTPEQEALDRSAEFTRMVREQGINTKVKYVFVDAAWLEKNAYYPPPINQIEIFRTYPAFFRERDRAILAHEAGHAELYLKNSPPINELLKEIEAYRKGMRLAKAWNVKDKFKELALHFTEDTLAGLPFDIPVSAKDFEEAKPELERFLNELKVSEG